jgi:predicted N-acetyltransferase YhbS
MEERAWEISTYEPGDKAGILALIRAEYGDVDLAEEAYFDWLRSASPPGVRQWIVKEKATGRVITAGTSVAARASWRGKELHALLGFNIVVAPEYRRQGIHTALTRQSGEDVRQAGYRFTTIFPNAKSMGQLARSPNYHLVSQVPLVIRPLDVRTLMAMTGRNSLLAWGAELSWQVAGRTLWRERGPGRDGPTVRISEDVVLDEAYDQFWKLVRSKYDLMLVRDRAFLQWRFKDIPTRHYQILSARQDGQLLGYIVLRQAPVRGIMTAMIADLLVLPGERGEAAGLHLLQTALQRFKDAKAPLVGGLMLPHTHEYRILRRAGFLRAPRPLAPQTFHLFVRLYADEPPLDAITCPESWYVSIADHDAV